MQRRHIGSNLISIPRASGRTAPTNSTRSIRKSSRSQRTYGRRSVTGETGGTQSSTTIIRRIVSSPPGMTNETFSWTESAYACACEPNWDPTG